MITKVIKIVVVNLIFLGLLGLTGCNSGYTQHANLDRAFLQACSTSTIQSNITTTNETVTIHATCLKAK